MSARLRPVAGVVIAWRRASAGALVAWRWLAVGATVGRRRWTSIGTGTTRRRLADVEAGMDTRGWMTIGAGMGTWRKGLSSVRLRATLAATLVVAVALGAAALTLVNVLGGSLQDSTDAEASRRVVAALPYALRVGPPPPARIAGKERAGSAPQAPVARDRRAGPPPPAPVARDRRAEPSPPAPVARDRRVGPSPLLPGTRETMVVMAPEAAQRVLVDPDVWMTSAGPSGDSKVERSGGYVVASRVVVTRSGTAVVWARASLAGARQALDRLNGLLLPGIPALLLVVAGMTWFSVGRALAPVAAIRSKVADITARDLHRRVPVPRARDEIAALATTVNGTLDRLETAVGTHKRFVADAAHELRSPIATLRARLELAEPSELTEEALADVERLQTLAADLLLLAKLDAGEPLRTDDLNLGQVAAEEALRATRRPDVRVKLDVDPETRLRGSRAHLARLVTNLVDNAVRHAATTVEVRVRTDGDQAVLQVLDDGPGIPPEQREAVFDRFTRLDEARARDAGGAGLGLPIAREIAVLHGGTLTAGDGGCTARFPAAGPEDRRPGPVRT